MFVHKLLGLREALPEGRNSQFVILDPKNNSVAGLDTQGASEGGGDNYPPVLVNARKALGIALKAPIYTADRAWKDLKLRVSIHVIR